jgi:hypothetical protein
MANINTARVIGRVTRVDRTKRGTFTHLLLPAHDEWSQPSKIRVMSDDVFGQVGEVYEIQGRLIGYGRTFTKRDGGQGEDITMSLKLEGAKIVPEAPRSAA